LFRHRQELHFWFVFCRFDRISEKAANFLEFCTYIKTGKESSSCFAEVMIFRSLFLSFFRRLFESAFFAPVDSRTPDRFSVDHRGNVWLDFEHIFFGYRMANRQSHSPDIEKWLKLAGADNVGPITFAKLIKHFGSVDRALGASAGELTQIEGIGPKTAPLIAATRDKFDVAAELELAERLGVWIIHLDDERYPPVLRRIYDPPPVLYIKGTLTRQDNLAVAIVGSRRCSLYGQQQSSRFAYLLGSAGFTIVSGLARGIDSAAHQGALAAAGRTIAVQGCGLANVFPPENKKLFELVTASGACVSELPLQYEPLAENFPPRNRIIAGLALGTIVVEAGFNSGALITAQAALDEGREVMAVPGKIDSPLSRGAHQLLKQGARLVESVDDVTEAMGQIVERLKGHVSAAANYAEEMVDRPLFDVNNLKLSPDEKATFDCLDKEPKHIEQIIEDAALPPGSIHSALVSLCLKGLTAQLPGSFFVRKQRVFGDSCS
jgi:DNA processing protein